MNTLPDSPRDDELPTSSNEVAITLGMLSAIESNSGHSQRSLAGELGIALGLANAYLKRCVRKGWIKVQQVPANRYAYYVTPQGFAEKARLTGDYLSTSLGFFRRARSQANDLFETAKTRRMSTLVLMGAGELAEIVALSALDSEISIVGIIDARVAPSRLAGLPIVSDAAKLPRFDGAIITDMSTPFDSHAQAVKQFGSSKVLVLPLLKIVVNPPILAEEAE